MSEQELRMPFLSHLAELRTRIIWSFVWTAIGFGICFHFSESLLRVLMIPMNTKLTVVKSFPFFSYVPAELSQKLYFTSLIEPFWTHLKLSLIAGIMLAFPFIMYQVWKFISPGLLQKERRYSGWFVLFASLFFGIGVVFCFAFLLPFAIPFLLEYKNENLIAIITFGAYVDFVLKFLLASGIVFELPLVIVLLSRMGITTPDLLARFRKYAVLGAFVLGALLTPTPDVFNQTLISIPIYFLYELGILFARLFGKRKKQNPEEPLPTVSE
ncbi:MAG: twin-arginine translocase subunit TatC [Nitrospirota bacterium]